MLLLLLALLVSARCEVRARDPQVEGEEEQLEGGEVGGQVPPSTHRRDIHSVEEKGNHVIRRGNWCAFVGERALELCGTEKCIVRPPCSSHGCQQLMDRLGKRQIHRQRRRTVSPLRWHCCPGFKGENCSVSDEDARLDSGLSEQRRTNFHSAGVDDPATLPIPHFMTLVLSRLEHLNQQVGRLTSEVAQLKSRQFGASRAEDPLEGPQSDEGVEERLDAKLDEVFLQIQEVQRQMEEHRSDMESKLHSQHAMLQYNLSSLKTDVDVKLKQHQKMMQVNLQAMNTTLSELRSDQDSIYEDEPEDPSSLPSNTAVLWEAVTQLDNKLLNNSIQVDRLLDNMEVTSGGVEQLTENLKSLERFINQTARRSQVLFMETGLEMEASKLSVQGQVEELGRNLTLLEEHMRRTDKDVDYLYLLSYKHNLSKNCDCKELEATVDHLERVVANVSVVAKDNSVALEEQSERWLEQWGGASDWEPAVKALQHGLQQVKEMLASGQSRTSTLDLNLTRLAGSLAALREADVELENKTADLLDFFYSLQGDVVRHNDVMQQLLGEEVLEFVERPLQDQEAHSILALKEELRVLQEQLMSHEELRTGGREEVPSADQPSVFHPLPDWHPAGSRRKGGADPVREQQLLLHAGDGGDLWKLEKKVEKLQQRLVRAEERAHTCSSDGGAPPTGTICAELMWMKRGLQEHLRLFKNVFINADVLLKANATLELDKLWELMKRRGGGRKGVGGRSRREVSESEQVFLSGAPVPARSPLFIAGSPLRISDGSVTFQPSLNRGQVYSQTGTFRAPVGGVYLFLLTLHLTSGPAHVYLRRGETEEGTPLSLRREAVMEAGLVTGAGLLWLREGQEVRLDVRPGEWVESKDNLFAGLLLHQST
ncbi:multimerin-2 isoform X1 [Oryzias melastigma]|uniref:multimerin-2 isoform X1 n=2 Tax=Oryzias melastigma TaxID=30732 RepID=UPI00168CD400|nr:multimerin-2 isoform X1 [Oryzias melastigma]